MEDEILVENAVENVTPDEPVIEATPEIIPNNPSSNPLTDGLQMAAYSAGVMLATTVMVNAGGHLLTAAGRGISKGAKWIGGKVSNGLEARKERKLLKKAQKEESSEEETENED